jgi:hypothetical protein
MKLAGRVEARSLATRCTGLLVNLAEVWFARALEFVGTIV